MAELSGLAPKSVNSFVKKATRTAKRTIMAEENLYALGKCRF